MEAREQKIGNSLAVVASIHGSPFSRMPFSPSPPVRHLDWPANDCGDCLISEQDSYSFVVGIDITASNQNARSVNFVLPSLAVSCQQLFRHPPSGGIRRKTSYIKLALMGSWD